MWAWRLRASARRPRRRRSSETCLRDRIRYNSVVLTVLPTSESQTLDPGALPAAGVEALYVHIPFCFHKCHYCDFYSITHQSPERMGTFVDRIMREAELWCATPVSIRPRTVFFG